MAPFRRRYLYTAWLQIAQSRSYLHTLGSEVGFIYILGALGILFGVTVGRVSLASPRAGKEVGGKVKPGSPD